MGVNIFYKEKNKLAYAFLILNLVFPILSVEGLIPWSICIFFMYKSIAVINEGYKSAHKCFIFLALNGGVIVIYNVVVYFITNHLAKIFL